MIPSYRNFLRRLAERVFDEVRLIVQFQKGMHEFPAGLLVEYRTFDFIVNENASQLQYHQIEAGAQPTRPQQFMERIKLFHLN